MSTCSKRKKNEKYGLQQLWICFFANKTLKPIATGKEVHCDVAQHRLSSAHVGNECAEIFVEKCLLKKEMSVFDKATKKLNTGIKKPPKTPKPVEALKEDVQGFRIIAEKNVPLNEVFKSSVIKLPMRIAESNTDFRGASNASKSRFCNSTLNKVNANASVCPESTMWIYDVVKFVLSVVP